MFKSPTAVALFAGLTLLAGSPVVLAEPGQGRDDHPPQMSTKHQGKGGHERPDAAPHGQKSHGGGQARDGHGSSHDGRAPDYRAGDHRSGYVHVDSDRVRVVIGEGREYWRPGPALPPGIRKNLQRGKPLPPGIDRHWLDLRLERQLPYYEGYEWVQVSDNLVLISISTGLVNVVLYDVFH